MDAALRMPRQERHERQVAVFLDLDGTWYRWQLFYEWIRGMVRAGLLPQIVLDRARKAYVKYKNREGPWDVFVQQQVSAYHADQRLKGIRVKDATWVAESVIHKKGRRVHVFPRELAGAAADMGMERAVISGSPTPVVAAFAKANGISAYLGTEEPEKHGAYTGEKPRVWADDKGRAIRHLARVHGFALGASVAIGDSATDARMFVLVGHPICFNPSRGLLTLARANGWPVVLEKKDIVLSLKPDTDGSLHEAAFSDILPSPLAEHLARRLVALAQRR